MALRMTSAILWPYTWSRDLVFSFFSGTEKEALVKQVEDLKTQLQRAEEHSSSQEHRVNQLSTNLESETNENQTLWDQVEYLTNELHKERQMRRQQTHLCQKERAMGYEQYNLRLRLGQQLEEMERQLAHQKSQEELLVCKERETRTELEKLTVSYNELHHAYNNLQHAYSEIQQRYDSDLKAEKQMNVTLQHQIQTEANTVSGYKELLQSMKYEQDALCQKMEQDAKLLQQEAAEKESLRTALEDLKIQRQLDLQKIHEEFAGKEKEIRTKTEELTVSYIKLHKAHDDLYYAYNVIQERYDTDLKALKQKNITLQQQLQVEANMVSGYKELVQSMKYEQDAFCQKMKQEIKLLQQEAAEKESQRMELEDLKIQLHEQTTKNLELVAQLKAEDGEEEEEQEEEVIQVLHTEIVQLMDELKDQVCQQEEESSTVSRGPEIVEDESPAVSQRPEIVEEESPAVLQDPAFVEEAEVTEEEVAEKKARSLWKRTRHFLGLRKKRKEGRAKETNLLQQEGMERESLHMELEDLRIQLHEQTTKSFEHVAQLNADKAEEEEEEEKEKEEEEEVIQVLDTEIVRLMDELKDQVCQQEGESSAVSQDPELMEEAEVNEEEAAEKKARSLWKRTRHFLGLRKKKEGRAQESTSNCGSDN